MKEFLIKILVKLIGEESLPIERKKVNDWLFSIYNDKGFQHYYTFKKKRLLNSIASGVKEKEYWELVGKLEALREIRVESVEIAKLRAKKEKLKNE